jgi:alcohol dehydrogenase class IV
MSNLNFNFKMPTKIISGPGTVNLINEEVKRLGGKRVMIVTGPVLKTTGMPDRVKDILAKDGIEVFIYAEIGPNPTDEMCELATEFAKANNVDLVIGLGGGSPMDVAKAVAILLNNPSPIWQYVGIPFEKPKAKLICIPTTAGSGSEVTTAAIFINAKTLWKGGIGRTPETLPDVAILDPEMTLSLPQRSTAETGMDALTHAIEAYTNLNYNPVCSAYALEAIRMISKYLRIAVLRGKDIEARNGMLVASALAGIAFSTKALSNVHAMSHPISAYYGTSHGLANAVLLPLIMEFNYLSNPQAFADVALAMGEDLKGLSLNEQACQSVVAVKKLMNDISMPFGIKGFTNISEEMMNTLADDAMKSGNVNVNPRTTTKKDVINLYRKLESLSAEIK